MSLKKHLLRNCLAISSLIIFCGNCNNNHITQEEEDFYTRNSYKIPEYTSEEFQQMLVVKSPSDITNFRKQFIEKGPKWLASGTEPKPHELWNRFRAEVLKELEEQFSSLKNYFDSFGKLLEDPTASNEKKLIGANKKLQTDPKAEKALRALVQNIYNRNLTESLLAYQEFDQFIHDNEANTLHLNIKKLHSTLAGWKKDGYLSGLQLWNNIIKQEKDKLMKESMVFKYVANQTAIEDSLKIADRLANSAYCVNYKELKETLPHGLEKLNTILDEVYYLKEQGDVMLLKRYCKLIKS